MYISCTAHRPRCAHHLSARIQHAASMRERFGDGASSQPRFTHHPGQPNLSVIRHFNDRYLGWGSVNIAVVSKDSMFHTYSTFCEPVSM